MRKWLLALALLCAGAGIIAYFTRSPQKQPVQLPASRESPAAAVIEDPALATPAQQSSTRQDPAAPAVAGEQTNTEPARATGTTASVAQETSVEFPAGGPESSRIAPATVVENMRTSVREYGLRFGGNPIGNNAEITRALNGGNPKQVVFIRPDSGLRINGDGELIDGWGTPFFFHQLSGTQTEIRSAGPDRVMWTADDLVTK